MTDNHIIQALKKINVTRAEVQREELRARPDQWVLVRLWWRRLRGRCVGCGQQFGPDGRCLWCDSLKD